MPHRVDFDRMAGVYDAARGLPPEAMEAWRRVLARYLPPPSGRPVLDLGSGTGRFSAAIARWFDVDVVAVEPAEGMRRQAAARDPDSRVAIVGGQGETVPLRDATCGAAWLSTVIHHFHDLRRAARETARVLEPGAPALIRSAFPGRHEHITFFRFFPAARRVAEGFPTVEATVDAFAAAGFRMESLEAVFQSIAPSLRALRDLVALRADTTLQSLSDEEFARGLAAMDEAVAAETAPAPIVDSLDLLVLRRA